MKIGRNDDCPCGSGKKYKKCCMRMTSFDGRGSKYTAYAVISEGSKYHSSFVLQDTNEEQELKMRDYKRKLLKRDDIEVVEYFTSDSKTLIKDVVNGLHNILIGTTQVLLIDGSNPYEVEVSEKINEAREKLTGKVFEKLDLRD